MFEITIPVLLCMHLFVFECDSQSQHKLRDLPHCFQVILSVLQFTNKQTDLTFTVLTNCYDLSQIHIPNMHKVSLLSPEDFHH